MSEEQTPQRIGEYEVLSVLGAGGMGKVYKVRNVITDRIEAMKVLLPDLAGQKELADRFQREIKVLASLSHPNIAALRTALTVDNQLVMIMELVEGTTLSARVAQGPIPAAEAVNYIDQVLAALSYAHGRHIIHRDIKPANMVLTPEGVVKLMDFGIARSTEDHGLTMTGTSLGSLSYMSPEQIMGAGVDARSDLYSVGISLYEMVTGRGPFNANSNYSMMTAHLKEAPTPPILVHPGLPDTLNQVILMALAKDAKDRLQSADAFRNALKAVSATLDASPSPVVSAEAAVPAPPAIQPPIRPVAAPSQPIVRPSTGGEPLQPESIPFSPPLSSAPTSMQPPPAPAQHGSYRGLYMTLGALIVIAVLVLGGLYGPRWAKTRAGAGAAGDAQQTTKTLAGGPAPSGAANNEAGASQVPQAISPPVSGSDLAKPAGDLPAAPPPAGSQATTAVVGSSASAQTIETPRSSSQAKSARAGSRNQKAGYVNSASEGQPSSQPLQQPQSSAQQSGSDATSQSQAANAAELDDLETQMDQLSTRTRAVKDSVENMRRQQTAQGLNLRGDISAAEDRMSTYVDKAQAALQNRNAKDARKYMDKAETDVETLEKFLGRR